MAELMATTKRLDKIAAILAGPVGSLCTSRPPPDLHQSAPLVARKRACDSPQRCMCDPLPCAPDPPVASRILTVVGDSRALPNALVGPCAA